MRVFVTGATGFVGSLVVDELLAAGHAVTGLARSEEGALALEAKGAQARRGVLENLDGLRRAAAEADAVAHLGFNHDFSRFQQSCEEDGRAILALGEALEGSGRPLLVTSGLAGLAAGRLATEEDRPPADFFRRSEANAQALRERGVQAATVRLAPTTHGVGDKGFMRLLLDLARRTGRSAYVGEGANRWAATHRSDAAKVFRLALEHGVAQGPFHAVAEEGVPMRTIAEALGRQAGVPAVSVAPEEAADHFGWFAHFAASDMAASSARTRERLGWTPVGRDLLADLADPAYFQS